MTRVAVQIDDGRLVRADRRPPPGMQLEAVRRRHLDHRQLRNAIARGHRRGPRRMIQEGPLSHEQQQQKTAIAADYPANEPRH